MAVFPATSDRALARPAIGRPSKIPGAQPSDRSQKTASDPLLSHWEGPLSVMAVTAVFDPKRDFTAPENGETCPLGGPG